ncbi:MAG TPA: 30S ribosomal protein S21 [Chitinophagales bacterium]|jgi:small subunit ribosomal protein S21|nr:30S ribosomal protein S21 [Chitinophagales bacterium]MCB9074827.1 30S ribosomal protein S21 [Chitinophagales bacterium]HMU97156.1 30S ribosomal protein S21 [Chitinophagales bacterium]HMV02483.1 30S ribosomal protein S21 [Chitinophagales bacterium]HMW94504.1 30S ribosomal protein S21 [Chitinophagales bacterium]
MLIVDAREQDSIDKALKVYKKKHDKAGVVKELRRRQAFTLSSVNRRIQKQKAAYIEQLRKNEE